MNFLKPGLKKMVLDAEDTTNLYLKSQRKRESQSLYLKMQKQKLKKRRQKKKITLGLKKTADV